MFPMEVLSCELEIAAWATTGNHQDFMVMSGSSGISWTGGTDKHNMAGIAGGSAFQDYRIKTITARRDITIYNCCPDPFPTLIYMVEFTRANYFYQIKLFFPSITITLVSFWNFWMDPAIGERLSFGIAVILAVTMNDVVATEMMPVTESSLLMDYVSLICLIFAVASLVETAVVLNLYWRSDKDWATAMRPVGSYKVYRELKRKCKRCSKKKTAGTDKPHCPIPSDRRGLFRLQLYKEIFFSLDKNHSGELELQEIESFALAVMGSNVGSGDVAEALDSFDDSANGRLNFDEFVVFCETYISERDDINMLTKLLRGYVRAVDRECVTIREMWKNRACMIDTISRFSIPMGFFLSLFMVFRMDQSDLEGISGEDGRFAQWMVKMSGFSIFILCTLVYLMYWGSRACRRPKKSSQLDADIAIEVARKSFAGGAQIDVNLEDEGEPAIVPGSLNCKNCGCVITEGEFCAACLESMAPPADDPPAASNGAPVDGPPLSSAEVDQLQAEAVQEEKAPEVANKEVTGEAATSPEAENPEVAVVVDPSGVNPDVAEPEQVEGIKWTMNAGRRGAYL